MFSTFVLINNKIYDLLILQLSNQTTVQYSIAAAGTEIEISSRNRILQDRSALRHFGTVQVGQKCPDISAPVLKCPKDTSNLSTKLSRHMDRSVPPYGSMYLT